MPVMTVVLFWSAYFDKITVGFHLQWWLKTSGIADNALRTLLSHRCTSGSFTNLMIGNRHVA